MIWSAISSYCFCPIITLSCRITASDYVDTLGNRVHPVVQALFPKIDTIFQDGNSPIHIQPEVFSLDWRSTKMHFNIQHNRQT